MRHRAGRGSAVVCLVLALLGGLFVAFTAPAFAASPVRVTALALKAGKTSGGARVDIYGVGFNRVRSVTFGSAYATRIRKVSATHLQVTAPAHAAGVVNVRVRAARGTSPIRISDRFTYVAPPVISFVSPSSGSTLGGTRVTISGSSFRQVSWVDFGAQVGGSLRVLSPTRLQVTAPPGAAGSVALRVHTAYGVSKAVTVDHYTYVAPATVKTISPTSGSINGGTMIELTGTDFASATAVTFDGVPGTNLVVHSATDLTVTSPAHAPGDAIVKVITHYGTSGPDVPFQYVALRWSGPTVVDPRHGELQDVSCPTASFCAAADSSGSVLTFNGAAWSSPINIDPSGNLMAISCTSASFCAAVDNSGHAMTFNGVTWSAPTRIFQWAFESHMLSCVSASFCMAVDDVGDVMTFDGSRWSARASIYPFIPDAIACTSTQSCVALSRHQAMTFDGTSWSSPVTIDSSHTLFDISCPTAAFCLAIDTAGNALMYQDGAWSAPSTIDPTITASGGATGVSCTSASFCLATEINGDAVTFDGSQWSAPSQVASDAVWNVSCATPSFCVAVGRGSNVFEFVGTSWSAAIGVDPDNEVSGISCASDSFCAAVDRLGNATVMNGAAWSTPTEVDATSGLTGVSCPSASFCAAVDGAGGVVTWDGSVWSSPVTIDAAHGLTSVSCPSASFCAAVDGAGGVVTWDGSVWSSPVTIDAAHGLTSVSCPSSSFCLAANSVGQMSSYDGTSWSMPVSAPHASLVSCSSTSFCAAVGGSAFTFNGGSWSGSTSLSMWTNDISCAVGGFCLVVGGTQGINGVAATFVDGQWSEVSGVDQDASLTRVSCVSSASCVAIDAAGRAFVGTGD